MAVSNPARINIQTNRDIIKSPVERSLLSPGDGCRIRQEPCRRSQGPSRAWQHGERVATTTRSGDRASTVASGGRYLRGLGWWRCCSSVCLEKGGHEPPVAPVCAVFRRLLGRGRSQENAG